VNNKIKILSVIVLLLFAVSFAMPFLTHINCEMDCCKIPVNTCEMATVSDNFCPAMTDCRDVIYIPIVSAPILKVYQEKDFTIEYLTTANNDLSFNETISAPLYHLKLLISEVHPGFQTPLQV